MRKATSWWSARTVAGLFQSPPSVRKATCHIPCNSSDMTISIPAFREEGDLTDALEELDIEISIPAFREEGDVDTIQEYRADWDFNPRLP